MYLPKLRSAIVRGRGRMRASTMLQQAKAWTITELLVAGEGW